MAHDRQLVGKCIKCEEEVSRVMTDDRTTLVEYDGAAEIQIHCGFGSSMDLLEFKAMICDKCLERCLREKILSEYRRYDLMGHYSESDLEWSDLESLFRFFKASWETREHTEEGRELNERLLKERGGKHVWPDDLTKENNGG